MTNFEFDNIAIGELYNRYLDKGLTVITTSSGHELIAPDDNLEILSKGAEYKKVKFLSRHKTIKHLVKITCSNGESITVTTDHICMAYNDDNMLENLAAKDLRVGSFILYYDPNSNEELNGSIISIENLDSTEDYVYDLEVEDDTHLYYANDILVHNSIFLNVEAISNDFIQKYNLDEDLCKWPDDKKLELFGFIQDYVDNNLIPKIQDLIHTKCYSNEVYMMRYGLEYLASGGVYEAKKHYGCHKIVNEGPEIVDKFKFTGVEIKKATIPPEIKKFLKEIYCRAILDNTFTDSDMRAELAKIYETVSKMSPEELGKWCGYKSERKMEGFLQPELGSTGTSKAVGFYNQIITDMGLGKKYDTIELGSKIQTIYIKGSNKYGIETIAFQPRNWPKEFNDVFEIDYQKMFDSLIMKPMDKFFIAMKFNEAKKFNPAATASLAWDVDDL